MTMKIFIENFQQFLNEHARSINIEKAIEVLSSFEATVQQTGPTTLKARSPNREELQRLIEPALQEMGYEWEPNAPGAGFGRFALRDKKDGNVYILLKPSATQAAGAGADYEEHIASVMQALLPEFEVETAGFGAGSDLTISRGQKELKLELKTSSGADFGQFKLKYSTAARRWVPIRTTKYIENDDLYTGIFEEVLAPNLIDKHIEDQSPHYNVRDDNVRDEEYIVGLVRMSGTRNKKLQLQSAWFGDRSDMKLQVEPSLVQEHYALKGDSLIQIQGRGVFALTGVAASYFKVPQLKDHIKNSYVRFRIKPHSGPDGVHSFTAALKITLTRSPSRLEEPEFLQRIENYLTN